jgi:biopolymer transport protein ExbB/TolQ
MFGLLVAGGPFMFATLTLSVVTLGIFLWRAIVYWGGARFSGDLLAEVRDHVASSRMSRAIEACNVSSGPQSRILKAALTRADRTEKEIRRAVETSALEEIPKIRNGTVYLPQLSNLATLFGLIGTIHGLIIAFTGAGSETAATRQLYLSRGIAVAFYNTFFGLIVATMGIIFYLVLLAKMNGMLAMLEHGTAQLIDDILNLRTGRESR